MQCVFASSLAFKADPTLTCTKAQSIGVGLQSIDLAPDAAKSYITHPFDNKNVIFIFPNDSEQGKPAHLWSNVSQLVQVSPYWKQLFSSGYKETESRMEKLSNWKDSVTSDLENIVKQHRSEDHPVIDILDNSEGEEAGEARPSKKVRLADSEHRHRESIRYVVVTDASIRTYEAVLTWIHTGSITFSALPSANLSRAHRGSASCKSVYALAHKLEIEELKKRACSDFASQLDEVNALKELFSKHAALYPDLSAAAMTATITHAKKIKAAGGHQYPKEVVGEGKVDPVYAGAMMAELAGKLW